MRSITTYSCSGHASMPRQHHAHSRPQHLGAVLLAVPVPVAMTTRGRICTMHRLTSTGLNMATLAAAARSLVSAALAARRSLTGTFTMYRAEASLSRFSPATTSRIASSKPGTCSASSESVTAAVIQHALQQPELKRPHRHPQHVCHGPMQGGKHNANLHTYAPRYHSLCIKQNWLMSTRQH